MQCPRCLNRDKEYFYLGSRGWYCRKCISFKRSLVLEDYTSPPLQAIQEGSEEYVLTYPLTNEQEKIARACAKQIAYSDVLLHCICGAGKTELVIYAIAQMLAQKKKVCFAIPRRQVVLELTKRLATYFPHARVVGVCQGYTSILDGDLIICTTHQLYRYYQAFDLLILDEPDAFPFKGNEVLFGIALTACRGRKIYLTATPDARLMAQVKKHELVELKLNQRPHGKPLPVPSIKWGGFFLLSIYLFHWLQTHEAYPRMIFVPTIALAKKMHRGLRLFYPCEICTSKVENKDEVIARFRNQKNGIIITTTIMERGVTIPNVAICVFQAQHAVFDEASLIQIAGRAGRTMEYPRGEVLFLAKNQSDAMDACVKKIKEANQDAMSFVS